MRRYRVSFYNQLSNDTGHMCRCCQHAVEIASAKSKTRALEAAKLRFARHEATKDWRLRAQFFEIEELASS